LLETQAGKCNIWLCHIISRNNEQACIGATSEGWSTD